MDSDRRFSACRALRSLREHVRGRIVTADDHEYELARQVYNGRTDRRPDAIVQSADVGDIVSVLRIARDEGIPFAVRGSGHSAAGYGVCHHGVVLDLSAMRGIEIDTSFKIAHVSAGVKWGEMDAATQTYGLATTGARISSTGVIGVTLGGGYGWLMRKCGLAVDNLLSANVVTANAQVITANEAEHPDLFWGLRGGCGNFGVVTSATFRLHSVGPLVTCGVLYYPVSYARDLLRAYRHIMLSADDDIGALFNILIAPDAPFMPPDIRGSKLVAIPLCDTTENARHAATFAALAKPLLNTLKPRPYVKLQRQFDHAGAFGNRVFGRSGHLPELSDELIDLIVENAVRMTSPLSVVMLSSLRGAVARIAEHDTAFSHRSTPFDVSINAVWQGSDDAFANKHINWVNTTWGAICSFTRGVYVNELGEEGPGRIRDAYNPQTYQRLIELKRRYDPDNFFRINHNLNPAPPAERNADVEPFAAKAEMDQSGRVLYYAKDIWPNFISCALVVHEKLIAERPQVVAELVRGIAESGQWAESHRMTAAKLVTPYFRQNEKLLEFVLTQPPDRVSYAMLTPEYADIQQIGDMAFACGLLNNQINVKGLVDREFIPPVVHSLKLPGEAQ